MNYLREKEDRLKAVEALRITREIMNGKAMREYKPEEVLPGRQFKKD